MGREWKGHLTSFALLCSFVVSSLFVNCSAANNRADGFTATASGPPSARTVVCAEGGTDGVATVEETISQNESPFTSFTLKCSGHKLELLPDFEHQSDPLVCTGSSTIDSCAQMSLEEHNIAAEVTTAFKADEKVAEWKIYPYGFPRSPLKVKVGCVAPPVTKTRDLRKSAEGRYRGCLVTILVRQAPPLIENNVVECSYGKIRTVTPVVSVSPATPFVAIRCGVEALFVPPNGRYCTSKVLEKCTPRSLENIFPKYHDSWWEVHADGMVLTIPKDQLQTCRKKAFFGCVLPKQTVETEKEEDYYCSVPVLFHSAARRQWTAKTAVSGAGWWWLTLLVSLSSYSVSRGTCLV